MTKCCPDKNQKKGLCRCRCHLSSEKCKHNVDTEITCEKCLSDLIGVHDSQKGKTEL